MTRKAIQFDQGGTPTITFINQATVELGVDFKKLVSTMQVFLDKFFTPIWGVSANLVASSVAKPPRNSWLGIFLDDADAPGALAYHDLLSDGYPVMKIFVKTTLAAGELVSVSASHELVETLVDPGCQMWASRTVKENWAYETADAVEETHFPVNGIEMTNFVYPAYFQSWRRTGKFDQLGLLKKPFTLLPGGYAIIQKAGIISQKFGTSAKGRRFALEDRRMHRSEHRR